MSSRMYTTFFRALSRRRPGVPPVWASVALLLGVTALAGVGIAGAAPLGAVTEFTAGLNPGSIPDGMAAGADGNLWFADRGSTPAVGRITPGGVVTEFSSGLNPGSVPGGSLTTGTVGVGGIAAGPDGNVWFTDHGTTAAIGRIAPDGAIAEFSNGLPTGSDPYKVTAGPDGDVWFTERATSSVAGVMTTKSSAVVTVPSGVFPADVALTSVTGTGIPTGAIVVSGAGTSTLTLSAAPTASGVVTLSFITGPAIGRITPSGMITEFLNGLPQGSRPGAIVTGPDGDLWFAEQGATAGIGKLDPATGAITEYSTGLNAGTVPNAITVGPDGNVWFTDRGATPTIGRITTGGTITEYSSGLPTGSSPDGIATGPDGSLWFADKGAGGAIGTIDPTSHAIVEYKTGLLAGSVPTKLAVGADGNLWVADTGTTKAVDRIGAGAAAASITPPSVIGSDGVLVPRSSPATSGRRGSDSSPRTPRSASTGTNGCSTEARSQERLVPPTPRRSTTPATSSRARRRSPTRSCRQPRRRRARESRSRTRTSSSPTSPPP